MREVDRRSKYDRRVFLKGAATAVPAVAIATSAPTVSDAWADDATTLTPATLKTLVKVARDIYPHDFLGDSYYITAIKPWDGKAAKDPATKSLINDGVARLDKEANDRHKVPYAQVAWETERVALLQRSSRPTSSRRFAATSSSPSTTRKSLAEVRLRGLLRRARRLHQARLRRHRLAPEGLSAAGNEQSGRNSTWQNSI